MDELDKYADAPKVESIDNLYIIGKKDEALAIMNGSRVVFRDVTDYYSNILLSDATAQYIEDKVNEGHDEEEMLDTLDLVKEVQELTIRPINKKWHVRCKLLFNDYASIDKAFVDYLHEDFDCHDLDADLEEFESYLDEGLVSEEDRPEVYFFVIDEISETYNLKNDE